MFIASERQRMLTIWMNGHAESFYFMSAHCFEETTDAATDERTSYLSIK